MNIKRISHLIYVLVVTVLIASCGSGQLAEPTLTPPGTSTPTLAPTPTDASTPIPSTLTPISEPIAEVQTEQGAAVLTSVERATGLPQNCDPNVHISQDSNGCQTVADPGHEFLIVHFMFMLKDSTVDEIMDAILDIDGNIYISTEDGQQYEPRSAGYVGDETQMFIEFSVPIGTRGFTLFWEDNPPIPLP